MRIAFPMGSIVKTLISYLSNVLELISPETITPEEKASFQKYVGVVYAAAKNFGPSLVLSSENDLDNEALKELIQICEIAANKYGFELNPVNISFV